MDLTKRATITPEETKNTQVKCGNLFKGKLQAMPLKLHVLYGKSVRRKQLFKECQKKFNLENGTSHAGEAENMNKCALVR